MTPDIWQSKNLTIGALVVIFTTISPLLSPLVIFTTADFDFTTAQIVINCTLKYACAPCVEVKSIEETA